MLFAIQHNSGKRQYMEDECSITTDEKLGITFFGIYDGHAGGEASKYCSKHLHNLFAEKFRTSEPSLSVEQKYIQAFQYAYKMADTTICQSDNSGTTAITAIVDANNIWVANCGDSRLILVRDGIFSFATKDHNPLNDLEKKRIINSGGTIVFSAGCYRVNGCLAMTRSIGDRDLVSYGVICQPEIYKLQRRYGHNDYMILMSDGILEKMSSPENQHIVKLVNSYLSRNLKNGYCRIEAFAKTADMVIQTCIHKNTEDNMSILIVDLL
jgi:protein phosphatase 1B